MNAFSELPDDIIIKIMMYSLPSYKYIPELKYHIKKSKKFNFDFEGLLFSIVISLTPEGYERGEEDFTRYYISDTDSESDEDYSI